MKTSITYVHHPGVGCPNRELTYEVEVEKPTETTTIWPNVICDICQTELLRKRS